jgi:hypothetical protein
MGWSIEGILCLPKEEGLFMGEPLDISQFNAMLHSKKGDSELFSALRELTSANYKDIAKHMLLWSVW